MPFKRVKNLFLPVSVAIVCSSTCFAAPAPMDLHVWQLDAPSAIASTAMPAPGFLEPTVGDVLSKVPVADAAPPIATPVVSSEGHMRKLLAEFAVTLRNIRYRRGGHSPSTGFDCSGFVRYVFQHSVGAILPANSASQFGIGTKVARAEMQTGDLVFFRIHGKRISHVGIYLDHGRFIHSPSSGKTVSIDSLSDAYWARHFAGAKRPKVLS